jgi:hypothetical protein
MKKFVITTIATVVYKYYVDASTRRQAEEQFNEGWFDEYYDGQPYRVIEEDIDSIEEDEDIK